jgi:Kazal-type serine protease inhibitor domain
MNMLSKIVARCAIFAATLAILASCTVVVDEPDRVRDDGPMCTREYDPVCGRRGGEQRSFANPCLADSAGFRIVRRGECRGGGIDGGGPRGCSREYDPVCARRGGDQRSFANSCLADEAGYRIARRGECRGGGDESAGGGDGTRTCTREYRPVCATRRGSEPRTFPNACEAEAARYRPVSNGECRGGGDDFAGGGGEQPRACTREYRPVCAARRGSEPRTFPNGCEAEAARYRIVSDGPC